MGENSAIEWTDHTFNPWIGCAKVAAGCTHCYAEAYAKRYGSAVWGASGTRAKTSDANWRKPSKWNREAAAEGVRKRVFCASLADVFEDWDGPVFDHRAEELRRDCCLSGPIKVTRLAHWTDDFWGAFPRVTVDDLRRDLFALIDATPHLDWLLVTKRPENVTNMWPSYFRDNKSLNHRANVWLLTSIATQCDADRNVPLLLECRDLVPVLGLSCEPLLGAIRLSALGSQPSALDWVIVGGESGPGARPMHPDLARSLRDQCQAAGVAFFFKQWGEWAPRPMCDDCTCLPGELCCSRRGKILSDRTIMERVGKKHAGRELDGREWNEYPRMMVAPC